MSALSQLVVPTANVVDSGSLRDDLKAALHALHDWLVHPVYGPIIPDLTSAAAHDAGLAEALWREVGQPRRELASAVLVRGMERGELARDLDIEMALDVIAGPLYWRLSVRRVPVDEPYLENLNAWLLRSLGARRV